MSNFIKLVNGGEGESHLTPPVHLKMLDKVASSVSDYIANLCFRGAAKTTLFMEYFVLYTALFGWIPGVGNVTGMIYVSDSMDNGVKSARKNIEFRYNNSEFLQKWIPQATFTDNYLEFVNIEGHRLGVKMFGAKTGLLVRRSLVSVRLSASWMTWYRMMTPSPRWQWRRSRIRSIRA